MVSQCRYVCIFSYFCSPIPIPERSKDPNIWDVGNLTDIKLQSLTLSIQLRDEEDQEAFPHLPQTATFTSGGYGDYHVTMNTACTVEPSL